MGHTAQYIRIILLSSNGPSTLFLLFVIPDESLTLIMCFFMHIIQYNILTGTQLFEFAHPE